MSAAFQTLVELCERVCEDYAHRELFGEKRGTGWHWITYAEFKTRVDAFRAALARLGVGPGDRVAIVSANRVEWAVSAHACYGRGAVFVPMYEVQPEQDWQFILKDCGAKVVIASTEPIYRSLTNLRNGLPDLQHVIGMELDAGHEASFSRQLKLGAEAPVPPHGVKPSDLAGLIYTSGTTGEPKGVMLTHENFCSNVLGVRDLFPVTEEDRSLSFLPWAHSFGQTCELFFLFSKGASMAINDAVPNLITNLPEVKPTILVAVPRIFNRIYDGVNRQMEDRPALIKKLFMAGLSAANKQRRGESLGLLEKLAHGLADRLIFSKIRGRFGGRLKLAISGSAALSRDVAHFVDALGISVYEGYGLTETSPIATANYPGHRKIGSVGKAIPGVTVKIDRSKSDEPEGGEILVFGPNVMKGYYNLEQDSRDVLTGDGGLRTGDLGQLDQDGYLFITGRIKEQYKLENGKYVAPGPLEEQLKLSPYIANVMIYGDNKPYNVALVVPDLDALKRWSGNENVTLSEAPKDLRLKELLRAELEKYSREFRSYERPKELAVLSEDFTVENGLLTPSLKLKRKGVIAQYGDSLQALYP